MKGYFSLSAAVILSLLGHSAEAIDKTRLTMARTQTARGERLLTQTEYAGAELLFRKAIDLEPKLPTAHLGLGAALVGQQRFTEALTVLEETEKRYVAWEQTILIAELQKRQLAERQILSIIDLAAARSSTPSPGIPNPASETDNQTAIQRIQTEQFIFRERWAFEEVHAIPAQVFYLEGIIYLRTGRRDQGIEALEICLVVNNQHRLAHYNLAVALFTIGDVDAAKEHLDTAVAGGVEPHPHFVPDLEQALSSR
ncbi:MAG: tetratricopeptide repeat protein [Thermoanaerobaculia bacterium]